MQAAELAFDLQRDRPYPGLRPFETDEEYLFYGREAHVAQLLQRLSDHRLLAVVGSSGTGKSSLVRAGLLPALYRGRLIGASSRWRVAVMRPGNAPLDNLAEALAEQQVISGDPEVVRGEVSRSSLGLARAAGSSNFEAGESLLLVVDQFEELFRFVRERKTEDGGAEAQLFVASLVEATEHSMAPVYVVLTMRSDFIGDCTQFPRLPEAFNRGQYLIPCLTREQIRDAVEKPLRVAGARMSPQLVERLLNELGDDTGQLPVLQHALNRTFHHWKAAGAAGDITSDDYDAAGTLGGALDAHADGLLASLDGAAPWVEKVFRCLTSLEGGRKVRRPTRLDRIYDVVGANSDESCRRVLAVIERYARRDDSLLVWSGKRLGDDSIIDISHECLITKWEKLREWVEAEAKATEWYVSAAKDTAWKRRTWRAPEVSIALGLLEQGNWNVYWAARLPEAKVSFAEVKEFILRGAAEQQQEKVAAEARRAKELADARALAEVERREREKSQVAHAAEQEARRAAEIARAAERAAREAADANAAAQARAKRWLIAATALLLFATVSAGGYGWSRRQVLLARDALNASVAREWETRNRLRDVDANLQETASKESEIRSKLEQANQSAGQREELQEHLAQLAQETDQLKAQRADAERRARTEADTRTQLEKQANVQKSAYTLAQKRITELETALRKAEDQAQVSSQTITALKTQNADLQRRGSAGAIAAAAAQAPGQGANSDAGWHSGSPIEDARAVAFYRQAAEAGNAAAANYLGYLYANGRGGLPKDEAKAVDLYRKAAEAGITEAMSNLGFMYEKGLGGLPKSDATAVGWYQQAADRENPSGMERLANHYERGTGGLKKDRVKASQLRQKAAQLRAEQK